MKHIPLTILLLSLVSAGCIGTPDGIESTSAPGTEGADGALDATPVPYAASGSSAFEMTGTCVVLACVYVFSEDVGEFSLPDNGTGMLLEATWTPMSPLNEELVVYVLKGDKEVASATGPSPLQIELGDLAKGKYTVHVWYKIAAGHQSESIDWIATGMVAAATNATA